MNSFARLAAVTVIVHSIGLIEAQTQPLKDSEIEARLKVAFESFQREDYLEAETEYRKLLASNPNDIRGVIGLAETLSAQNRVDDAIQMMQANADKYPSREVFELNMGNLLVRAERYEDALKHFETLLEKSPNDADLLYRIGEAQRRRGSLETAMIYFRRAITADPGNPQPILQLASLLDGTGKPELARPLYERLLVLQPDHAVALNNLAYIEVEMGGDLDHALALAERARQKQPGSPDVADTIGTIYLKKGMAEPAIASFKESLRKLIDNSEVRGHLADALELKHNLTPEEQELLTLLRGPRYANSKRIQELLQ